MGKSDESRTRRDEQRRKYSKMDKTIIIIIIIIITTTIIFINYNWVVTRWQWLCYMSTKHEIGYY
jgi:hypothetical protein